MKTIMILGAGIMQLPGIRIAQRNGWKTVVVDGNASALGREMGDRFEVVDLKDRDGLCALGRRIQAEGGLHGVFTAGTDFSSSVAWVAEKLGLPGLPFATAMRATDKCLMRDAFTRAGVPGPRHACWAGQGDPASMLGTGMEFPLVVKPVDNMGARGVRRVETGGGLADACRSALPLSRSGRVIIEQYMEGPELSLDAVVYRGKVTVCGVADRHIYFPPSFVEMGHTMPTELDARTVAHIEAVFTAGVRALGIDNGAAKGDIKLTPAGPMIGEIAARLSGGYMSGWTFPLASGVEVTRAALNIAMGIPPGDLSPRWHRTCAERALISIPGVVTRVEGEQAARAVPGVEDIFLRITAGTEVVFPTNNVEKCGNVIAVGVDREEAVQRAGDALSRMCIRLRPSVDRTTRYLFHETGNDALSGPLFAAAAALPRFRGNPSELDPDGPLQVVDAGDGTASGTWYATPVSEAVTAALRLGGGALTTAPGPGTALGSIFWHALARGGTQGALYLLDTVRNAALQRRLPALLEGL